MGTEHIVRSFAQELQRLSNLVTQMGGVAEAQVEAAVKAVTRRDVGLASQVMQADARLDAYECDIDAEAVRLLALRQPMAQDLREIGSALNALLIPESTFEDSSPTDSKLSKRQKQLIIMLDRGLSNREIADELGISEHTVKVHLWRLFRRLGVKSRTQAVHFARTHGILGS